MSPKKVLAIKLRAMGDTVLLSSSLQELRRLYPRAEIHALVLTPWTPVIENHPAVDTIIPFDRHGDRTSRAKAVARMALRLRREKYDVVANFHASPSSSILAFSTGAKLRAIHFHGHRAKNKYSTVEVPGKGKLKPIIQRDLDVVRALGASIPESEPLPLPRIWLSPQELDEAKKFLRTLQFQEPLLGLGLGSSRPTKSWELKSYAELSVRWCEERKGSVLGVLGPDESEIAQRFSEELQKVLVQRGFTQSHQERIRTQIQCQSHLKIRQLAALQAHCSVFLGNDSGPRHLAVATRVPTVTLFGPENPFEWHPYPLADHPSFFIEDLSCRRDADPGMPSWCALHVCVSENHRCMKSHSVDQVFKKCVELSSRPTLPFQEQQA